jgi:hypothetical protein
MALRHPRQLIEILRATLENLENDPAIGPSNEEIARLKRDLVRWIAAAEATEFANDKPSAPPPEPPPATDVPAKTAIQLALAIINKPPA